MSDPGASDQGLGRDAARIEAVAPHLLLLDQGHLRPDRRGDEGGDQPAGAGADDDQIAIEGSGALPATPGAPAPQRIGGPFAEQGQEAEQQERSDQPRRRYVGRRSNAGEFGTGIDIDERRREHPGLADRANLPRIRVRPMPRLTRKKGIAGFSRNASR